MTHFIFIGIALVVVSLILAAGWIPIPVNDAKLLSDYLFWIGVAVAAAGAVLWILVLLGEYYNEPNPLEGFR